MISVVLPTCNRPDLLRRAVASVLGQTYQDFELIVVDDCSSMPASTVLADISDPRMTVARHDRNSGAPAARNTGIALAKGEFIAFLDDDDEYLPSYLKKLLTRIQQSSVSVGVVCGGMRLVDETGRTIEERLPKERGMVYLSLLRGEKDANVMALVRRECFEKNGVFDTSLPSCQDWDMWLRLSKDYAFDIVPEVLTVCHCHRTQLSGDFFSIIGGRTRMVEKHRDAFLKEPGVMVIHLKRLGKLHALNGTWKEAWRYFADAARIDGRECFRILAWIILEYPQARWFSPVKDFKRTGRVL